MSNTDRLLSNVEVQALMFEGERLERRIREIMTTLAADAAAKGYTFTPPHNQSTAAQDTPEFL